MAREKRPKVDIKKAKSFLSFLKPYYPQYALGFVFLVGTSIISVAMPMLIAKLLGSDYASNVPFEFELGATDTVYGVLITLAILMPALAIFSFFRVYLFSWVTQGTLRDLRLAAFTHLVSSPISFFDKNKVGELTSRIATDTNMIEETLTTSIAEFIRQLIVVSFSVVIIFIYSTKLALIMLSVIPVVAIVAMIFGKYIKKLSRAAQDEAAKSNSVVEEALMGIKNLKAYTNEFFEINNYKKTVDDIKKLSMKSALWRGLFIAFIMVVMFGAIVFIMWQGIEQVKSGDLEQAHFFQFLFLTVMLGTSIGSIPDLYSKIQKSLGATENLMNLMQETLEPVNTSHSTNSQDPLKGDIEMKDVSFYYETRKNVQVLNKVNLRINQGETVALVGSSGSGKSTLASLLLGFYETTEGTILFDGKEKNSYNLSELRSNIAYVPQEVILFGGTIEENIRYGKPSAGKEEVIEAAKKANAHNFVNGFPEGYQTLVGDRGIQLSGGQKQRIAIARAVLKNPSILILDEATSALDSESEQLVQEALDNLMQNRTSVVIAHRLSTIKNANQILVLQNGEIVEKGTHHELSGKENGVYKKLSELQFSNNN
ncbi:MAG: ABC transporter ATP-binding protein [Flavobacteriales bacterium]